MTHLKSIFFTKKIQNIAHSDSHSYRYHYVKAYTHMYRPFQKTKKQFFRKFLGNLVSIATSVFKFKFWLRLFIILGLSLTLSINHFVFASEVVNIYSYRQPFLIQPLLEDFKKQTGITPKIIFASSGLTERLKQEGKDSPADVVLTVDVSRFRQLDADKLSSAIDSQVLKANIPKRYRSQDNTWFGLTLRARIIYASKERVKKGLIQDYEDLTESRWRGKICTRSGYHRYNLSLLSSIIAAKGEAYAQKWLTGLKRNLARRPQGNDRQQIKAIRDGLCDISIGNSYYYGKMLFNAESPKQASWAKSVYLIFPNQGNRGTHMNISGAALTRYAPNKANALKLIEFLSSDSSQYLYAEHNYEFPVNPKVKRSKKVAAFPEKFKEDSASLTEIMKLLEKATIITDKVGFDN